MFSQLQQHAKGIISFWFTDKIFPTLLYKTCSTQWSNRRLSKRGVYLNRKLTIGEISLNMIHNLFFLKL